MYQRILVPVDGSVVANLAVDEASQLAHGQRAQLCLVHVIDLGPLYRVATSGVPIDRIVQIIIANGRQELAEAMARARHAGVEPRTTLLRSDGRRVSDEIIREARRWPADLIVMGTHGRRGLERLLLGSVAEGVARESPVPVLLVPGSTRQPNSDDAEEQNQAGCRGKHASDDSGTVGSEVSPPLEDDEIGGTGRGVLHDRGRRVTAQQEETRGARSLSELSLG